MLVFRYRERNGTNKNNVRRQLIIANDEYVTTRACETRRKDEH